MFSLLKNLASSFLFVLCFSEMLKGVRPKRRVERRGARGSSVICKVESSAS